MFRLLNHSGHFVQFLLQLRFLFAKSKQFLGIAPILLECILLVFCVFRFRIGLTDSARDILDVVGTFFDKAPRHSLAGVGLAAQATAESGHGNTNIFRRVGQRCIDEAGINAQNRLSVLAVFTDGDGFGVLADLQSDVVEVLHNNFLSGPM